MKSIFVYFFQGICLLSMVLSGCTSVSKLESQGLAAIKQQQYHKAVDTYEKLLQMRPSTPVYYYNLAVVKAIQGRFTEAEKDATTCIRLAPDMASGYAIRGRCRYELKNYRAALEDLDRSLELNNEKPAPLLDRGITHIALKDCRSAIRDLNRALHLNGDSALAFYNLGIANNQCKSFTDAIGNFNTAERLWPDSHIVQYSRAFSYMYLENYSKAIADFSVSAKHHVYEDTSLANIALCYMALHDTTRCMEELGKSLLTNPRFTYVRLIRASIQFELKNDREVITDLQEVLRLNDTCFNAMRMMYSVYRRNGDTEKANALKQKMIVLRGDDAEMHHELFRAYASSFQYDEALREINLCLEKDPDDFLYNFHKGKLLYKMKAYPDAYPFMKKAERIGKINDTMAVTIGWLCYELDSLAQAVSYMEKAIAYNPRSLPAHYSLFAIQRVMLREKDAYRTIDAWLAIEPKDTLFLWERAQHYKRKGNISGALQDLQVLLEQQQHYDAYIMRGHIYRGKQQYAAAAEDYGKAAALKPDESSPLLYRGDCFDLLGKKTQACAEWRKACTLGNKEGCIRSGSECK